MNETIKALSIKQPWAWAICNLPIEVVKDIENRSWNTKYRGEFLVHAGKTFDYAGYIKIQDILLNLRHKRKKFKGKLPAINEFVKGAFIGVSSITDVVNNNDIYFRNTDSPWYDGEFGFVLEDSKPFENPIPYKGQLNFFNVSGDVVRDELENTYSRGMPANNYEPKVGDIVTCRRDSFDAITQASKHKEGMKIFSGNHEIKEIVDSTYCRLGGFGAAHFCWHHKKDLLQVVDKKHV